MQAEEAGEKQRAIALYEEILSHRSAVCGRLHQPGHAVLSPAPVRPRRGALPPRHRVPTPATCSPTSISATCSTSWSGWTNPSPPTCKAVTLSPRYADAHYNLALAYERTGQNRHALRHWHAYIKLDNRGPWADHARGQIRKLLSREKLSIAFRADHFVPPRKGTSGTRAGLAKSG